MATDETKDRLIRRGLLTNTFSNQFGNFVLLGVGVILTPFILHRLGPAAYGLWILLSSVGLYGAVLDFGLASAVTKYVAQHREQDDMASAQSLIATALWLYSGLGLVAFVLFAALIPVFPLLFHLSASQRVTSGPLLLLLGLGLAINLPCMVTNAVLRGLQRFDLVTLVTVLNNLLFAGGLVLVLLLGGGLFGMVFVNIPATLLIQVPSLIFIRRLAPDLRIGWRGASRGNARKLLGFSSANFVLNLASRLTDQTDEIVIGGSMRVASVTPYNIALRLSRLPLQLSNKFAQILLPLASQLHAAHDWSRLRSLYIDSTRITLAFFVPGACILVVLAQQILTLWVGATYDHYFYLVFILVSSNLMAISQYPAVALLQGMARQKLLAVVSLATGVANLVLSIVLVHRIGLAGVALGTLIPYAVEWFGFVLPFSLRVIGVRVYDLVKGALLPPLLPAIPMVLVLYALRRLAVSLPGLAVVALLALAIYLVAYLGFGAGALERGMFDDVVLRMRTTLRPRPEGPK